MCFSDGNDSSRWIPFVQGFTNIIMNRNSQVVSSKNTSKSIVESQLVGEVISVQQKNVGNVSNILESSSETTTNGNWEKDIIIETSIEVLSWNSVGIEITKHFSMDT